MARIERYDPVMGTREYLALVDGGGYRWTSRFYSTDIPDGFAEQTAAELNVQSKYRKYLIEVLY